MEGTQRVCKKFTALEAELTCECKTIREPLDSSMDLHNHDGHEILLVLDGAINFYAESGGMLLEFVTGNQGYFATVDDFNACTAKEAPGYEDHVVANYENSLTGILNHDSTYTSPSTPELITDINLVKDEYQVECITCPTADFDATFDRYLSELESAGVQTIIDERTEHCNNQ